MTEVQWGLLSTAAINRHLIPAIRESRWGRVAAVASRDLNRASAYAAKWEIPTAHGSYEDLLADPDIHVIYIGLPNHLHAEWSIRALEAGKHVLCEKPLALSVAEVDQMTEASRQHDRRLAEAFMYVHHPQARWLREFVRSGRLGEIQIIRAIFTFYLESLTDIRRRPEFGGGTLWDIGVYPVSFSQMIVGSAPKLVSGQLFRGGTGVDETFTGELIYEHGPIAQIGASFQSPYYTHADILGTEGRLWMTRPFHNLDGGYQIEFNPKGGEPEEYSIEDKSLYLGEVEDMNSAVLEGTPNALSLEDSRRHIATVQALYLSAERNQPVSPGSFLR
jgi:D-xylose 1-dehydrogenase (NADP+, D-xylono-1,5-lactone-forming)